MSTISRPLRSSNIVRHWLLRRNVYAEAELVRQMSLNLSKYHCYMCGVKLFVDREHETKLVQYYYNKKGRKICPSCMVTGAL